MKILNNEIESYLNNMEIQFEEKRMEGQIIFTTEGGCYKKEGLTFVRVVNRLKHECHGFLVMFEGASAFYQDAEDYEDVKKRIHALYDGFDSLYKRWFEVRDAWRNRPTPSVIAVRTPLDKYI